MYASEDNYASNYPYDPYLMQQYHQNIAMIQDKLYVIVIYFEEKQSVHQYLILLFQMEHDLNIHLQ